MTVDRPDGPGTQAPPDGAASWQPWDASALDEVMALADRAHPAMPERPEVLARKAELYPEGAFLLRRDAVASILGYALAHPWRQGFVPPLDYRLEAIPDPADCLFLHDCVVAEAARGANASGALVGRLHALARARGLVQLTLIAAYGSARLWGRHGFAPVTVHDPMLIGYGASACAMAMAEAP